MRKYNMTLAISKALAATPALLVLSVSWLAVAAVERWQCYRRARRERTQLLGLGERELRDIGLSRVDAIREAGKSLWGGCAGRSFDLDLGRPQP
jgi:uncharacterized protein YjiS (DUF1127 family)